MATSLKNKFYLSALSPLSFFLILTGVFLQQSDSKRKRYLFILWSFFWLTLGIQSNAFIFIKRSQLQAIFSFQEISVDGLIRRLVNVLFRLNGCIFDTFIHYYLIVTIRPTVMLFLEALESIDCDLKSPTLSPRVKRLSLIGLLYIVVSVRIV